jgi:hypothetical protein
MNLQKQNIIIVFIILLVLALFIYLLLNYGSRNNNYKNEGFKNFKILEKDSDSKIAFLFLTYNNLKRPDVWNKFLDTQTGNPSKYANKFTIYLHAKEPQNVTDLLLQGKHIPENIETCWGCFGTVEANILMLKAALKDPLNKKFILVSESCIPIVSFDKLYNELMKDNKSIINIFFNQMQRYDQIVNPEFSKDKFTKSAAQGLVFNRNHAELLVNSLLQYKNDWKNMECVDEHYFCNILRELDLKFELNNKNNKFTFDVWDKDHINDISYMHIKNGDIKSDSYINLKKISNKAIDDIRENDFMFSRKVDKDTDIDVEYILS